MKQKIMLGLVILSLLFIGCLEPKSKELPTDFELVYISKSIDMQTNYELIINNEGKAIFTKTLKTSLKKTQEFTATKEELNKIYLTAMENNFFLLEEKYIDNGIVDADNETIKITANGITKSVNVKGYIVPEFQELENEIILLLETKLGKGYYLFNDLKENCDDKKIECEEEEKESAECIKWKEFCEWEPEILDENGTSFENPIIIEAENEGEGIEKEYEYLNENACKNNQGIKEVESQELEEYKGHWFDVMHIICINEEKETYYFNIDSFFGIWD